MINRLILILLFITPLRLVGQELKMYKSFGGVVFELDTITLSMKQTMGVLQKNVQAYQEFKKAKRNLDLSSVMGFTGGVLLAIPVITSLSGGTP